MGFFIAGDITYNKDGAPSAIGYQTTTDDALKYIEQNPLRPTGTGFGTYRNSEFLRSEDLRHISTSQNTARETYNFIGNINIRTTETINLTIGGSYIYSKSNRFSYFGSMANSDKNSIQTRTNYRIYGKFTQRFPGSDNKSVLMTMGNRIVLWNLKIEE